MRLVCIGDTGHLGYVFKGLKELDDVSLIAIAPGSPSETLAEAKWHIEDEGIDGVAVFDDYRQMLDAADPDIVVVAPHFQLHAEAACEVMKRSKPVFCEKPLALTLDSLEQIRQVQKESGQRIGMMMNFRYAPAMFTARKLVQDGIIGEPTTGYAQKSYKWGKREDYYKSRETFGGIIPWVGIHAIDWLQWVSGRTYRAVSAKHVKLHRPDYPGTEDAATCLFELDNGGTAVMSFDYLRPSAAGTHGDDRLRLIGEKGVLEVHGTDTLHLITDDGEQEIDLESPEYGLFADFVMSIKDPDHECLITTEDTMRLTETVLKARDAADSHTRIEL